MLGGSGENLILGGDDRIRTSDGSADIVNCGMDNDRAVLDLSDVVEDAVEGNPNGSCESVTRRSPAPGA